MPPTDGVPRTNLASHRQKATTNRPSKATCTSFLTTEGNIMEPFGEQRFLDVFSADWDNRSSSWNLRSCVGLPCIALRNGFIFEKKRKEPRCFFFRCWRTETSGGHEEVGRRRRRVGEGEKIGGVGRRRPGRRRGPGRRRDARRRRRCVGRRHRRRRQRHGRQQQFGGALPDNNSRSNFQRKTSEYPPCRSRSRCHGDESNLT